MNYVSKFIFLAENVGTFAIFFQKFAPLFPAYRFWTRASCILLSWDQIYRNVAKVEICSSVVVYSLCAFKSSMRRRRAGGAVFNFIDK